MRRTIVLLAMGLVAAAGCASDDSSGSKQSTASPTTGSGPVTVFAAASLTEALEDLQSSLAASTDLDITYSFGGSGTLATQIEQGAPADVLATADTTTMQRLVDGGLVETPVTFARNRLAIAVPTGNPKGIQSLTDLARPELNVVLADSSVPAGRYAATALQHASVAVTPVSLETDVKAVVARVTSGEADAGIVYATDARAADATVDTVTIPDEHNVIAEYPIAVVTATTHRLAALAFLAAVTHGDGQRTLQDRGFLPPP